MTDHDIHLEAIAAGSHSAFAKWLAAAEPSLRRSLASFARRVDTEAVLQEAMLRVWQIAPRIEPDGKPNALVRLGMRIARNLAVTEIRRRKPGSIEPWMLEDAIEWEFGGSPGIDPDFRAAIEDCFEKLPPKPRLAMETRMASFDAPDGPAAASIGMKLDTFVQNIRRARLALAACLRKRGIKMGWNQ